jgi:peptidyl-prolyl cis-trans isomerase C
VSRPGSATSRAARSASALARSIRPRRGPLLVPRRRASSLLTIALAALVVLGSGSFLVVHRLTAVPDGAVLEVGGVTVSQADYQSRTDVLSALYGVVPPNDPAGKDRYQRDVAQAVATSLVIDQQATAQGVVVTDKDVQDALNTMIQTQFPQGRQSFDQALSRLHISQLNVTDEIHRQLAASRLFDKITGSVPPVTDADVAQAYQQRQAQMVTPEARHLRNIVVGNQQQAQQLADQARGGADFAALAASSLDKSTAGQGGDLGTLAASQLEKPYADAAFAAPAGSVFGPVQTGTGWNVGQVVAVQPATPLTLDQVKEPLRQQVDRERRIGIWRPWLTDQVKQADVRYADAYQPANPDELPADSTP